MPPLRSSSVLRKNGVQGPRSGVRTGLWATLVALVCWPAAVPAQVSLPSPTASLLRIPDDDDSRDWAVAGYDNGFFVQDRPGDDARFQIRINGWGQFRVASPDFDNPSSDDQSWTKGTAFEIERARLVFSGFAYDPSLTYFLQLDGDSDQQNTVDLLDAYVDLDVGQRLFDWEADRLRIRAGRTKVPLTRARSLSGRRLAFADRSIASLFFDGGRAVGFGMGGRLEPFDRPAAWHLAVFNGLDTGSYRPGTAGDLDGNPAASARFVFDPVGDWGTDSVSDLTYHERLAVRVGAGTAFSSIDSMGQREFDRPSVVDSGGSLADLLPASTTGFDETLFSLDASAKWRGVSLFAEWYGRSIGGFEGGGPGRLFDYGLWLHAGAFVVPETWEVFVRNSRVVGDSGTLGRRTESADEVAVGTAWYLNGEHAKLIFDATRINGSPLNSTAVNVDAGDDGMLYRLQLQLGF